jgi:Pretoxin HINT domain
MRFGLVFAVGLLAVFCWGVQSFALTLVLSLAAGAFGEKIRSKILSSAARWRTAPPTAVGCTLVAMLLMMAPASARPQVQAARPLVRLIKQAEAKTAIITGLVGPDLEAARAANGMAAAGRTSESFGGYGYDTTSSSTTSLHFVATKSAGTAISRACRTGNSFAYDTEVLMADGKKKPIGELKISDKVIASDPETGLTAGRVVTAVHLNLDTALADLTVVDADGDVSVIHTTQHHPFWNVTAGAWIDVIDLQPGDRLRSSDGSFLSVVTIEAFVSQQWMWDLTVDEIHSFYVANGDESVLVHNCLSNQLPDLLESELDAAAAVGARPIRAGAAGFDSAVNSGTVKFAVLQDGSLVISPHSVGGIEISHTVLSGGAPVRVAGHANIAGSRGSYFGLDINAFSGHFGPGDVALAKAAFAKAGVVFGG